MTQTLKYYDNVYIFNLTQILYNRLMPVHVYYIFRSMPRPSSVVPIQSFTWRR